jgi:hypothetical protein
VDGSTLNRSATTGALAVGANGASLAGGVPRAGMSKFAGARLQGNLTASDAAAGVFSLQNTYGTDLIVERLLIRVTTASSGACTIDVGCGTTAATSYDTILDGPSVAATGMIDNADDTDQGTNGNSSDVWKSGEYLSASMASGATAGLVGTYQVLVSDMN